MIHIERGSAPAYFSTKQYEKERADLKQHFKEWGTEKRRSRYDFAPVIVMTRNIRKEVAEMFGWKCAYCETRIGESEQIIIDQYRPKQGARGLSGKEVKSSKDAEYHEKHYWWKCVDWDNQLPSCPYCNRFKGSWFPLADEAMRAAEPGQEGPTIEDEEALLLDPCTDDPQEHLHFDDEGRVKAQSEKGRVTIELLNLNRRKLVEGRRQALRDQEGYIRVLRATRTKPEGFDESSEAISTALEYCKTVLSPEVTELVHLAPRRQQLNSLLADDSYLYELIMRDTEGAVAQSHDEWTEEQAAAESVLEDVSLDIEIDFGRLAIEKIQLRNFKNIEDLTIEMPMTSGTGRAPWLVFLGENAVGKSAIIQAITLTLMGDVNRAELPHFSVDDVLRYTRVNDQLVQAEEGWVRIWVSGIRDPLQLSFRKGESAFHSNIPTPRSHLLAYGSTRLFPDEDVRAYESEGRVRVRNLFRSSAPLVDAEKWLWDLNEKSPEMYDLMVRGLREMLLMKGDETIEPDRGDSGEPRIMVRIKNETTLMHRLSDGYRTILALACDLMYMLSREGTSMDEAEGVVIIDEIGSNLHPAWKKRVVDCFRNVFPRIQFIVTTHEPLCLRGLHDGETILLRRDIDDNIVAVTNLPNPQDLRVDQLLMSEFFGLNSTVETDLEDIYDEYYKLLTMKGLNPTQKKRKAELKERLRERQHLGVGLRDELMYEVIDQLLARELRSARPKDRKALKKETLERVLDSWKQAGLLEDHMEAS